MKKRLHYIDSIKVFALILVFVCHYTRSLEANGVGYAVKVLPDNIFNLYIGSWGVSLFFIASGASLMYVYEEKLELGVYLKKRFLGIYPMFWMAFLIATSISFFRNHGINAAIPKWKIILSIIGFDGNTLWWGANFYQIGEWFLAVIICLYILFPLLRKCVVKYPVSTSVISLAILAGCMVWFNSKLPIECLVFSRLPEFIFGMLFVKYKGNVDKRILAIGIVGIMLSYFVDFSRSNVMIQTLLVGVCSFICLSWVFERLTRRKLIAHISTKGAKYCYPVFLTHHYLTEWLTQGFKGIELRRSEVYLLFLICFMLTLLVSRYIEKLNKNMIGFLKS